MCYWHKDRPTDQKNREPRNKSLHICGQMIFAKRVKTIQWGKDKWQWEKWISTCKRMKLDLNLNIQKLTQNEPNT